MTAMLMTTSKLLDRKGNRRGTRRDKCVEEGGGVKKQGEGRREEEGRKTFQSLYSVLPR
jgi:hypothetical protein